MNVLALVLAALAVTFSVIALRRTVNQRVGLAHAPQPGPAKTPAVAQSDPNSVESLYAAVSTSLRHVAVVRYDAFDDVTGRQSFTAAILDDNSDGIVITSLHARSESRTLLKGITAGHGDGLSPEEQQAVDQAKGAS